MASYGDVRQWRPGPLADTEQQLKRKSDSLLRLNDEFAEMAAPREWTGDAATSARREHGRITDRMEEIVASVSAARSAIGDASDAIVGLVHAVEEADGLAQAHGFAIGDDGAVNDVAPPQDVPEEQVDEVRRERERVKAELVDRVEQILRRATYIEARSDPVGDFGAFGIDPSHLDGMDYATSAEARHPGDGRILHEVTGHTSYLDDGSTSQYNMAVISGGMSERMLDGADRGIGDVGSWPIPGTY